jgi:hypothetical protein
LRGNSTVLEPLYPSAAPIVDYRADCSLLLFDARQLAAQQEKRTLLKAQRAQAKKKKVAKAKK